MFQFVLQVADAKGLLKGKTVAVDATTLEANAAMKSIVRRDTGEDWQEYIKRLMQEAGEIAEGDEPSAEESPGSTGSGKTRRFPTKSGRAKPIRTAASPR